MKKRIISAAAALLLLTGCGSYSRQTKDLTAQIKNQPEAGTDKTDDFIDAQYRFTVSMLQAAADLHPKENQLYTPYLAAQTVLMAANGAEGSTRDELLALFGGGDVSTLSQSFAGWRHSHLPAQFTAACSVWINSADDPAVKEPFLQTMHNTFEASVFSSAFDENTLTDMNKWVSNQTNGAIPECISQFEDNEVLLLLSAGVFDAQWSDQYADNEVKNVQFHAADGSTQTAPFLCKDMDEAVYLQDEYAVGMMRSYRNNRYAFAALMPQEITLEEYIGKLTAETLRETLRKGLQTEVDTMLPKFSVSYAADLKPVFQEMGVQSAYQGEAAFSGISDSKLFLNRTQQLTKIDVNQGGTTATFSLNLGAEESACAAYRVILNKPFLYMIYDREYGLPVLIGTVQSLE